MLKSTRFVIILFVVLVRGDDEDTATGNGSTEYPDGPVSNDSPEEITCYVGQNELFAYKSNTDRYEMVTLWRQNNNTESAYHGEYWVKWENNPDLCTQNDNEYWGDPNNQYLQWCSYHPNDILDHNSDYCKATPQQEQDAENSNSAEAAAAAQAKKEEERKAEEDRQNRIVMYVILLLLLIFMSCVCAMLVYFKRQQSRDAIYMMEEDRQALTPTNKQRKRAGPPAPPGAASKGPASLESSGMNWSMTQTQWDQQRAAAQAHAAAHAQAQMAARPQQVYGQQTVYGLHAPPPMSISGSFSHHQAQMMHHQQLMRASNTSMRSNMGTASPRGMGSVSGGMGSNRSSTRIPPPPPNFNRNLHSSGMTPGGTPGVSPRTTGGPDLYNQRSSRMMQAAENRRNRSKSPRQ